MKPAPRPYRNQRLHKPKQKRQQQILEVSIRRDKERAKRVRQTFWLVCKAVLIIGAGFGMVWGARTGLRRFLWQNPTFYLTDLRVRTDGTLTREQVLAAGGITEGANIFSVDLKKIEHAIEHLPQVVHVDVRRRLPHRVDVEIVERQPVAWVTEKATTDPTSESALLIDVRGYVMKSRKVPPDYYNLPTISGVVTEDLAPGQKVSSLEMQAALDLIRLNADSTRWQVRNVDLAKGYCLVVTDRTHARITFGLDDMQRQLSRLNRLLDYLEPKHKEIQTVNLLVERNIPVTFTDSPPPKPDVADATPAPAPATPTPTPTPVKVERATSSTKPKPSGSTKHDGPAGPKTKGKPPGPKLPPDNVRNHFGLNG